MFASSLLTLALSFGITLIPVQAAIIPVHNARGDEGIKIVPEITCTPLTGATGSLFMTSTDTSGINAALAVLNNTLQEDNVADGEQQQQFEFQNCTSTFMAETPTDTTFYGHITLSSDSLTCLVSSPGESEPQLVTTAPCRTADDSGQTLQFWKFTTGTGTAAATLDFVGESTKLNPASVYVTGFDGTDGSRVAQIDRVDEAPSESPYQITLVPS